MPPRKAPSRAKGKGMAAPNAVPDVFQEMLAEALPAQSSIPERPLKRRRIGTKETPTKTNAPKAAEEDEVDDDDIQFEDVLDFNQANSENGESSTAQNGLQTAYRDSEEDESEGSDHDWDALDFDLKDDEDPSGDLELTLTKKDVPQFKAPVQRRRLVGKDERVIRLQVHKMHVLCLISFLDRRNEWCNDAEVQATLKPLFDKKTTKFLRPSSELSQFGQTNSLKNGIEVTANLWRTKYKTTSRGMRRALWAEDEQDLQNYELPEDIDKVNEKSDFREAAKTLKGSRDIGAQLYCALLRSVGVETRLVCSLQPLSFTTGGPAMPKPPKKKISKTPISKSNNQNGNQFEFGTKPTALTPRQRLGHPMAADYNLPTTSSPSRPSPSTPKPKPIIESPFPIFWLEVFDTAHQKWFPVDPLVTESHSKPKLFEPPASDHSNALSYILAFEEDGTARDVTKRYTKAYNAKTRKQRVESTPGGDKWLRKALRPYRRGFTTDADQIEDTELAAAEAREPMPKNIQDFKDHPYYALERHLKRNEVLVSTKECGKVAAGRDASKPGGKKLESVFRRRDVRIARSADKWYRLGRDVKMGEIPIKTVEPKRRAEVEEYEEDRAGTNLYTEEQTELYIAPPVVDGRVPRNSFGNIDVYVPSMVPAGGVHILEEKAVMAARILGIDYAPALTGFAFKGRHGTAVLKGVVVAEEYREAVEVVIGGIRDEVAKAGDEARSLRALRGWKRFLVGLRIKERVNPDEGGSEEEEDGEEEVVEGGEMEVDDDDEGSDAYVDDDDDFGGGGFMPE